MPHTHTFKRGSGAEITVHYTAKPGSLDGWMEPGDPPEIEIEKAVDITGADVLDAIPDDEVEAWERWLCENHDFSDYEAGPLDD